VAWDVMIVILPNQITNAFLADLLKDGTSTQYQQNILTLYERKHVISLQQMSLKEIKKEIKNTNDDMFFQIKNVKEEFAKKVAILEKAIKEHPDTIKSENARKSTFKMMRKELKHG
jgi:hypothetical protein